MFVFVNKEQALSLCGRTELSEDNFSLKRTQCLQCNVHLKQRDRITEFWL